MKKRRLLLALLVLPLFALFGCEGDDDASGESTETAPVADAQPPSESDDGSPFAAFGLDEDMRFIEPRTISVALWERPNDRIPAMAESYWAMWVQDEIYARHNIIVEWSVVPRWGPEYTHLGTLFGAGMAPDVSFTFNQGLVTTLGQMDGLQDLAPLLASYGELLPNLYNLLGEELIYWNLNPTNGELLSIMGRLFQDGRSLTFIREDWLAALDLPIPVGLEQFEETLIAFRDNAHLLPGNDGGTVIPYLLGQDVTWHGGTLFESLVPSDITDREWFIRSIPGNNNERLMAHEDVIREGSRILNRWFNENLLWNDFVIADDHLGGDLITLGQVGAFTGNWDFPFRANPGFIQGLHQNVGPDANFIPIMPFLNDVGQVQTFMPAPTDRYIFLPTSNNEQLASLLYLDFMSSPDVLDFLQFGYEGVHHEVLEGGAIRTLAEDSENPWPDNQIFTVLRNFDIALTINGIHFTEQNLDAALATLALGYPGIAPEAISHAREMNLRYGRWFDNVPHGIIASEEGMIAPLMDTRDVLLHTVIAGTSPEDFDSVFDQLYEVYMSTGARAIMEERTQIWEELFGN